MQDSVQPKILLIDDDTAFQTVLVRVLTKEGYQPLVASDGPSGISLATHHLPDLILCDLEMPGMHGYQVLSALRNDPETVSIPVIFLTGLGEPAQVRAGMNLGADDYLTKPVHTADLLKAIDVRLQRRQAERHQIERQTERATQLLAEVVHDLRNPLFSMLVCGGLLKDLAAQPQPHHTRSREIIEKLEQAAGRMQTILARTMLMARSHLRQLPFKPERFDLRDFCERLVAEDMQAARLSFQAPAGAFPVRADAFCLRQALENLIANAVKYSEGVVTLRLAKRERSYQIDVSDTGIGIPAEEQTGIFQPFFRASNARSMPGHGLGLCIVRNCIELHGGTIKCCSAAGQGTTFSIDLPVSLAVPSGGPAPAAEEETSLEDSFAAPKSPSIGSFTSAAAPPAGGAAPFAHPLAANQPPHFAAGEHGSAVRLTAIIVEDDPLARSAMRELLEQSNSFIVLGEADTVRQARALTRRHQPEVVFLDVNLPDRPGFDLLHDLSPQTAVVFVTSSEEYAAQAFDCEAVDYLVKPVSLERLQKTLSRVRTRQAAKSVPGEAAAVPAGSFIVRTLAGKRLVKVSEVRQILAYGEYSWVYWEKEKKGALLRKSLKQWLTELPPDRFIRIHRRAIVNLDYVDSVHKSPDHRLQVYMRDSAEPITVSLRLATLLKKKLKESKGWWP